MMKELLNFLHTPNWDNQHRWRTFVWNGMAGLGLTGLHAFPVSRHWVEVHRREMHLTNLDPAFHGFRIVQLSDLHYSPMVWATYLRQFVEWVNLLKPDLVVVTGDLVTGGYWWSRNIGAILKNFTSTHGVLCTLGNHDYSMYGRRNNGEGRRRADYLEKYLLHHGLTVLRNQTLRINHKDSATPLTIVGLDDEWSGAIDPVKAFKTVRADEPIICLNHNPANAVELLEYPWQWMLSGHTHGRQLAQSRMGKRFYAHLQRAYTHGYYEVAGRHLYVNRGLAYGQRKQRWCRPEISVFRLNAGTTACSKMAKDKISR
ncbi:MAG: metallophosphoesterase [Burkholderiales bacterium]|nr:metallophosphoesterase [Phycisphaerae bacterium]